MKIHSSLAQVLIRRLLPSAVFIVLLAGCHKANVSQAPLTLNDSGYFEAPGLNILVFNNWYNGLFSDSKISGIEIIHHGVRTATNGDVRLNPTPEQWDPIPQFVRRSILKDQKKVEAYLQYPAYDFQYHIETEEKDSGVYIRVILDKPLPQKLAGVAGFNLEFRPSAYFKKSYMMDNQAAIFPLYPCEDMEITSQGKSEPLPMATGKKLVLAPEDPQNRVSITSLSGNLMLYDGRNKAQNGWYVVRSLIPAEKTGVVTEWFLSANIIPNWIRKPVIGHSQVGYHPAQNKIAVIELDQNDTPLSSAKLLKIEADGSVTQTLEKPTQPWGTYLRYKYLTFDFSEIKTPGLYELVYGPTRTAPFRIDTSVYANVWHPTLDVYFPVQMDHMYVKEAYRVWHGASHLDDALQAPVNHEHFDLYAQGPTTDTPYKPLQHIPGLNVGGWYDAGDFDIRTQTQYAVVLSMVNTWENFHTTRDETSIDQKRRHVNMHVPDGKPDLLQQIEHGTLQLLAQFKAVGHAINGIICSSLSEYTHLGDAVTKTDNLIYKPGLDSLASDGMHSGAFDDRWAFTSKSTPLNYGSAAALAAASRALKDYNPVLAGECLKTAQKVWTGEQSHQPDLFRFGNTTGGPLETEKLKAAMELLKCTHDTMYQEAIMTLWPAIEKHFERYAGIAVQAIPYMPASFRQNMIPLVKEYENGLDRLNKANPYGVFISTGGWAGNGQIIDMAVTTYHLYREFPEIINREHIFSGLNYIYGCHPGSDISFVSAVGTSSKMVAYGNNRADFTFIAGGIVPGELILNPDFPENKEDWPFLWGENEYVVNVGASYIFLTNAINELLHSKS